MREDLTLENDMRVVAEAVGSGSCSVALAAEGKLLAQASGPGIRPLALVLSRAGWDPAAGPGSWRVSPVLGDRVVGKAAALLAAGAGVRAVWAQTASRPGQQVLEGAGIPLRAGQVVPYVAGARPGQKCPLEQLVALLEDPAEGSRLLWVVAGLAGQPEWVKQIRDRLGPAVLTEGRLGRLVLGFEEVTSTNEVLRDLGSKGYPEGTVALACRQSAGRGRLGRAWASPPGGMWMSVLLRPPAPYGGAGGVLLALGSLACQQAVSQTAGVEVGIKWPNDLYLGGKKLGGVLAEASGSQVVLGMGLNLHFPLSVFPPAYRSQATTLQEVVEKGGYPGSRLAPLVEIAVAVIARLDELYRLLLAEGPEPLWRLWREKALWLGQEVRVTQGEEVWEGRALDIDPEGALLVSRPGKGIVRVVAGDVSLRPD